MTSKSLPTLLLFLSYIFAYCAKKAPLSSPTIFLMVIFNPKVKIFQAGIILKDKSLSFSSPVPLFSSYLSNFYFSYCVVERKLEFNSTSVFLNLSKLNLCGLQLPEATQLRLRNTALEHRYNTQTFLILYFNGLSTFEFEILILINHVWKSSVMFS